MLHVYFALTQKQPFLFYFAWSGSGRAAMRMLRAVAHRKAELVCHRIDQTSTY